MLFKSCPSSRTCVMSWLGVTFIEECAYLVCAAFRQSLDGVAGVDLA